VKLSDVENEMRKDILCKFGVLLTDLEPDDIETIRGWIIGGRSSTYMADVLNRASHPINRDTIKVHLRGLCMCQSETQFLGVWDA